MANLQSDRRFFLGSCALLGLLVTLITVAAGLFTLRIWAVGDTRCFYDMATVILSGGTPYLDYQDPKPPLIFFLLTLPQAAGHQLAGGLVLVGIANFASAVLLLLVGWKLYGRLAGLLAAVLFAVNFSLAEGYFIITEPFTVTFILLSVYFLVCGSPRARTYLLAGLFAGVAIGFKQYALLLLPVSAFLLWRKKEYSGFLPYLAGTALPLLIMFGALFVIYGFSAGEAALHWSFGVAGSYMTESTVDGVPAYKIDDPVIALAWLVLGFSLFGPLILLAGAALLARKGSVEEEFFLLSCLVFSATLLIRPFLHYWALSLPFLILLAAAALSGDLPARALNAWRRLGDGGFLAAAAVLYSLILLVSLALSAIFVDAAWRPLDIQRFYGLADIVLKATNSYLVHQPEPALVQVSLYSPGQSAFAGIAAAAILLLCSAVLITRVGMALYGRRAGLLAGALFTLCMAWVPGYLSLSDALALLLLTLSLFLFVARPRWCLAGGICLGGAIALKPLALLVLPALVYWLYREGELKSAVKLLAGALAVPIAAALATVALVPGTGSPLAACIRVDLLPLTTHGGGYTVTDPLIAMLNIVLGLVLLTVLLPVAALVLAERPASRLTGSLLGAGLLLLLTLPARLYVHYWFLALPFFTIVCGALVSSSSPTPESLKVSLPYASATPGRDKDG